MIIDQLFNGQPQNLRESQQRSAYDQGGADAWYHRGKHPEQFDNEQDRAEYLRGYEEEGVTGRNQGKQYESETPDTNDVVGENIKIDLRRGMGQTGTPVIHINGKKIYWIPTSSWTMYDEDILYKWFKVLKTIEQAFKKENQTLPRFVEKEILKVTKMLDDAQTESVAEASNRPVDMTGKTCEKCKKDQYQERSQHDDMEGKVTCSCGHRVDRWKKKQGVAEVSAATLGSYAAKARKQAQDLEPHAVSGEYQDLAKNIVNKRKKGQQLANIKAQGRHGVVAATHSDLAEGPDQGNSLTTRGPDPRALEIGRRMMELNRLYAQAQKLNDQTLADKIKQNLAQLAQARQRLMTERQGDPAKKYPRALFPATKAHAARTQAQQRLKNYLEKKQKTAGADSTNEGYRTDQNNRDHYDDIAEWKQAVTQAGGGVWATAAAGGKYQARDWNDQVFGEFDKATGQGWIVSDFTKVNEQDVQENAHGESMYQLAVQIGELIQKKYGVTGGDMAAYQMLDTAQLNLTGGPEEVSDRVYDYMKKTSMVPDHVTRDNNPWRARKEGTAEATGDVKFDKMLKGITAKKAVAKQRKADTQQQARDAFGGMFGGGNPADKLGLGKKDVSEAQPTRRTIPYEVWKQKDADIQQIMLNMYPDLVITGKPQPQKKPRREKIDYQEIARKIEEIVGNTFPDGDPIDLLIPYMRRRWGLEWDLGQHLDRAARRHLGARSYDDYLATLWDQVADDELMPDHVTHDNNP
jgi:hypothetical protein